MNARPQARKTIRPKTPPLKTLRAEARALVETCPAWNSRLAARRISLFFDRALAETGMTTAQLGLMAEIAAAEDDTLGALARRTGLEQSTLSRNLRTLEAEGRVEIAAVERDQRRRAVWLTEAGARRLESAVPIWRKAQAKLTRQLRSGLPRRLAVAAMALPES
jgi:DNA-binding MarR family transcriptional regulator